MRRDGQADVVVAINGTTRINWHKGSYYGFFLLLEENVVKGILMLVISTWHVMHVVCRLSALYHESS